MTMQTAPQVRPVESERISKSPGDGRSALLYQIAIVAAVGLLVASAAIL